MKYLFLAITVLLMLACDSDEAVIPPKVKVSFNTSFAGGTASEDFLKSGTYYDRGNLPDDITELNVVARNLSHPEYADIDSTFTFVDSGGNPMEMELVTGENEFTATATSGNGSLNGFLTMSIANGTFAERAATYSNDILSSFPIYSTYEGTATVNIDDASNVELSLVPQLGRVTVVFENHTSTNYTMIATTYLNNVSTATTAGSIGTNISEAYISSWKNTVDGAMIKIVVQEVNQDVHVINPVYVYAEAGINKTYVLKYNP